MDDYLQMIPGSAVVGITPISSAAKAAAQQALETLAQEAVETPQQTSQEARTGDRQAQQLLAKQAAAQKVK